MYRPTNLGGAGAGAAEDASGDKKWDVVVPHDGSLIKVCTTW